MAKLKTLILMFVLLSTTTFCYADLIDPNENGDGTPVEIISSVSNNSQDRGLAVNTYINGHNLMVSFSQNIGEVSVEITSLSGTTIYNVLIQTPTGQQFYIPSAGSYIITFTLPNGNEYYGEFVVTD